MTNEELHPEEYLNRIRSKIKDTEPLVDDEIISSIEELKANGFTPIRMFMLDNTLYKQGINKVLGVDIEYITLRDKTGTIKPILFVCDEDMVTL